MLSTEQRHIFLAAMPFVPFVLFNFSVVRTRWPNWSDTMDRVALALLALGTCALQILWQMSSKEIFPQASLVTASIGTFIVYGLSLINRKSNISFWRSVTFEGEVMLLVSYAFCILPLLVPHQANTFLGAFMFCLYCLFVGSLSLRTGQESAWSLAVFMVGVRLFIAYAEIMGSLALQGIGFIMTGFVFLCMAWFTHKLMRSRPQWLVPAKDNGGSS
jgi:hypothetical protein